jgi:hypothetical protein
MTPKQDALICNPRLGLAAWRSAGQSAFEISGEVRRSQGAAGGLGGAEAGERAAHTLGPARLNQDIVSQATVMTYSDLYWVFGVGLFALIPLVLLLKPLPKGADVSLGG